MSLCHTVSLYKMHVRRVVADEAQPGLLHHLVQEVVTNMFDAHDFHGVGHPGAQCSRTLPNRNPLLFLGSSVIRDLSFEISVTCVFKHKTTSQARRPAAQG